MKHLFYIHSYVTYLVALGVIENKGIRNEDVILICGRGVAYSNDFVSLDVNQSFPSLAKLPTYGAPLMYLKKRSVIHSFDQTIAGFTNNEFFICYLPSNNHYLLQLLASHKLCCGTCFIEEGLFSYNEFFYKRTWPFDGFTGEVKRFLNTGCRNVKPGRMVSNGVLFTLFNPSFYASSIRKECVMPQIHLIPYNGVRLVSTNLLMLNAFKDADQHVRHGVLDILSEFADTCNEIYIKHHPYSDSEFKHDVEAVFSASGVDVHIIPDNTQTELMLANSSSIRIFGFFSAAMMYGALFGHRAFSFAERFRHYSSDCAMYCTNSFVIPKVFDNNVTQL